MLFGEIVKDRQFFAQLAKTPTHGPKLDRSDLFSRQCHACRPVEPDQLFWVCSDRRKVNSS
jgi:hypothetical protein